MKRILIVSHSFFESNMGAVRQRRIARHLPACGFEPIVMTREGPAPADGPRRLAVRAPDLAALYRRARRAATAAPGATGWKERDIGLTSFLNRWFMIPDKQVPWTGPALRAAVEFIRREKPDLIFGSLDPRTNIRVAAAAARKTGTPCVIEYRDLWTGNPYHHVTQPTALHRAAHRAMEKRIIRAATRVTTVCRGIADYLGSTYAADLKSPVALHYNFFDPSEYPPPAAPAPDRPFVVSYVGAMYITRHPRFFFEGLRLFIERSGLTPAQFRFRWVGSAFSLGNIRGQIAELRLESFIDFVGQVPHRDALTELVNSHAALIIQAADDAIHIPGKLFEALGARVPVLALANPCEVTDIMALTNCGIAVPHEAEAVAAGLRQLWEHRRHGAPWPFNETAALEFTADRAVSRLADLFEEAIVAHR